MEGKMVVTSSLCSTAMVCPYYWIGLAVGIAIGMCISALIRWLTESPE
jgi:ABC-type uncharacterized transport system permease subunit